MRRKRNFEREYQQRIRRGLAAGKSRSAARGHPRAADLPTSAPGKIDRGSPVERALARMRRGETQTAAAKAEGVSAERLRAHLKLNTVAKRQGRKVDHFRPTARDLRHGLTRQNWTRHGCPRSGKRSQRAFARDQ